MARVSFIGVGVMGAPMVERLLDAGHDVTLWNRSDSEVVLRLVDRGARRVATVTEAFSNELVLSMLANDAAVLDRITENVLRSAPAGALHVNLATISMETADRLAELHLAAGLRYVAAPVLGRPTVAAAGQLNIVAGGPAEAVEAAREVLEVLGKRVWHVGEDARTANLVKIGVNYNLIHAIQALAESVTLVEAGGVDGQQFVDILTDAAFTGSAYVGYGKLIASRDYGTAFPLDLGMKDLRLTEEAAAAEGVALPTATVLHELFQAALDDPELAPQDWSAVAEITRRASQRTDTKDNA